jgi:VanZ family protein
MNDKQIESATPKPPWFHLWLIRAHSWSGFILCGYFVMLLMGTHIPNPEGLFPMEGNDKWLHFCAYFGLAFLLATWRSTKTQICGKLSAAVWFVTAIFGALDELTQQIPGINRHCDFADWIADVSGAASGLLIWHLLRRMLFAQSRSVKLQNDTVQE